MKITVTFNYIAVAVALICMMSIIQANPRGNYCSHHTDCVGTFGCFDHFCTHPCNNSFDAHIHCEHINDTWVFTCHLGYQFQSEARSCQPIEVTDCKDDSDCAPWKICSNKICIDPCVAWPMPHSDCKVENHLTTRTCHAGYERKRGMRRCILMT